MDDFMKQKIIYPDIAQSMSFAMSESDMYLTNTGYFLLGTKDNLNFVLKVLNSKLIEWYYRTISVQLGIKAVRMFSQYVEKIPIPQVQNSELKTITADDKINNIVFSLYGLTIEQKEFIINIDS